MIRKRGFNNGFSPAFGNNRNRGYIRIATPLSSYDDQDIISAVSWRSIRQMQCEQFIKAKIPGGRKQDRLNSEGLYNYGDVIEDYLELTHQYKFIRTSATTCTKVRLSDLAEIEFQSNVPFVDFDGRTAQMHIPMFFGMKAKTLKKNTAQGAPLVGNNLTDCVFYGGNKNHSHEILDQVWDAVESKMGINELDQPSIAPFSPGSYRKVITISVNSFDDDVAGQLTEPLIDDSDEDNIVIVQKRKRFIQWRDLRDVVESDVLDPKIPVRIEHIRKHVYQTITQEKSL